LGRKFSAGAPSPVRPRTLLITSERRAHIVFCVRIIWGRPWQFPRPLFVLASFRPFTLAYWQHRHALL